MMKKKLLLLTTALMFLMAFQARAQELVVNGGFESPAVAPPGGFVIVPDVAVPEWNSSVNNIELWDDGFLGVPSYDGDQFAELEVSGLTIYSQDFDIPPNSGGALTWSFAHRGRLGTDELEFFIGPASSPVSQGIFSAPTGTWTIHSGSYLIDPDVDTVVRIQFLSQSPNIGAGNLLDGVSVIATLNPPDEIPTMNEWAMLIFALSVLVLGTVTLYNFRLKSSTV